MTHQSGPLPLANHSLRFEHITTLLESMAKQEVVHQHQHFKLAMDRGEIQHQLSLSKSSRHHRSNEWIFRDVPSDITLEVNGTIFSLHKFPLVSRSGRIRRVVAEHNRDGEVSRVELIGLPGGAEAFELAAKFCYGVNFEITANNVAELCCVSDYLEMTEEQSKGNLGSRAEEYLEGVVCRSLELSVEVLRRCETLTPLADELRVVSRCVEAVAARACAEQIASSFSRLEYSSSGRLHMARHGQAKSGSGGGGCKGGINDNGDWWIEDISVLRIDMYRRVITAMKCRGVRPESIGASLATYAQNHHNLASPEVVDTVISLLPSERHAVPITFLFGLLRTTTTTATTAARAELERRIAAQLDEANLDDLLIPSFRHAGDTLFDVDAAHRILACFAQRPVDDSDSDNGGSEAVAMAGFGGDRSEDDEDGCGGGDGSLMSPSMTAVFKVGKLVDSYLAEIAADSNLKLAKFMAIADALPTHARTLHDGLYRAIDIYLKAHCKVTEAERRKLTKLIDFQKLSSEAGAHAAQNERLPLQSVVQVLYIEQLRLRNSLISSDPATAAKSAMGSPRDNYASLRRENRELKLELARLRMRLNDLERDHISMKREYVHSNSNSASSAAATFLNSFSRKFGMFSRRTRPATASTNSPSNHSYRTDSKAVHRTCASTD